MRNYLSLEPKNLIPVLKMRENAYLPVLRNYQHSASNGRKKKVHPALLSMGEKKLRIQTDYIQVIVHN